MYRLVFLALAVLLLGATVSADTGQAVQLDSCLTLAEAVQDQTTLVFIVPDPAPELSLRALANTLAIGLLTVLCFIPAVLLTEWFKRRGDTSMNNNRQTA